MTTLLLLLWIIAAICLALHASIHLRRTTHSWFELQRAGDKQTMRRERLLGDLIALRQFAVTLLVIIMTSIAISLWAWQGILAMVLILVVAMLAGRIGQLQRLALLIYLPLEPRLLLFVERFPIAGLIFGSDRYRPKDQKLESKEQLIELIDSSNHILSDDQRYIIHQGLDWHMTKVSSVMTPKKEIVAIKDTELLGPLVLDDLHRSGHDRFPVIKGNLDTVVGVLDVTKLLDVGVAKRSETAEKAMTAQVLRIEVDATLPAALSMLQKSHQHMVIVVDDAGKTVGLVTLADITQSLLGKQ